jgi:KDO2-lipid IV(A) lauroyltransferase
MIKSLQRISLNSSLWLFKLIPFWLLYRLSDGLYFLLYYVIRVRRKVVRRNLRFVFNDYPDTELKKIEKQAYKNFCDIILETAKGFTLSPKEMSRRYAITNPELIDPYYENKRGVIGFIAHYNNWEWGVSLQQSLKHKAFYIYKRMHNRVMDDLIRKKRQVSGAQLVYKEQMAKTLIKNRRSAGFYALIADQRPSGDQEQRQVKFFDRDISCFAGPEMIAKTFNYPVVYCKIERIKRGFYQATGVLVTDDPKNTPEGEISQQCFALLEAQIKENPGHWMWMHKRFKGLTT